MEELNEKGKLTWVDERWYEGEYKDDRKEGDEWIETKILFIIINRLI